MFVQIDGTRLRGEATPSGDFLTVIITDMSKAPETVLSLLSGAQEVRRLDAFGRAQAAFAVCRMKSVIAEVVGGRRTITACLDLGSRSELERLRERVAQLEAQLAQREETDV